MYPIPVHAAVPLSSSACCTFLMAAIQARPCSAATLVPPPLRNPPIPTLCVCRWMLPPPDKSPRGVPDSAPTTEEHTNTDIPSRHLMSGASKSGGNLLRVSSQGTSQGRRRSVTSFFAKSAKESPPQQNDLSPGQPKDDWTPRVLVRGKSRMRRFSSKRGVSLRRIMSPRRAHLPEVQFDQQILVKSQFGSGSQFCIKPLTVKPITENEDAQDESHDDTPALRYVHVFHVDRRTPAALLLRGGPPDL